MTLKSYIPAVYKNDHVHILLTLLKMFKFNAVFTLTCRTDLHYIERFCSFYCPLCFSISSYLFCSLKEKLLLALISALNASFLNMCNKNSIIMGTRLPFTTYKTNTVHKKVLSINPGQVCIFSTGLEA